MNTPTHDPYLDAAKRSMKNKRYKELQHEKEKHHHYQEQRDKTGFLSQKVNISDLLNLPEGTINLLLFIAFLVIPYTVGIIFIFVVIAQASLDTFASIHTNEYTLYWAIGYEVVASFLILLIIKSAINFHNFRQKK